VGQSLSGWEASRSEEAKSKIDPEEMAQLIATEIPRLRRLARFLARDRFLADDLVQECLMRAVSHLDTWEPGTNLRGWLMTILRNVFLSELRRVRLTPDTFQYDDAKYAIAHAGMQDCVPDLAAVQRAFDRLSDEHREVLFFVALEGFSYEEAASFLNLPIGTVRSRLARARRAMRALMLDLARTATDVDQNWHPPA
jgi:RNA polymerase sigma-70 factor (ECF subfamily)